MPPPNPPYPRLPPSCHRPKASRPQSTCSYRPPLPASGRDPALVVLLQAGPAVPERLRLRAAGAGDQHVEVHVPTGADFQQGGTVGQAPMDHAEQHLVTPGRQFEAYLAAPLPGDGELARRIALGDAALHPVLVAETRRPLSGRVGELIVAPD